MNYYIRVAPRSPSASWGVFTSKVSLVQLVNLKHYLQAYVIEGQLVERRWAGSLLVPFVGTSWVEKESTGCLFMRGLQYYR